MFIDRPLLELVKVYATICKCPGIREEGISLFLGMDVECLPDMDKHKMWLCEDENGGIFVLIDGKLHKNGKLILPDEIENLLIQKASDIDKNYWDLGDITVDLVDELKSIYPKFEIRGAIARTTNFATETIRDQERMSRMIPANKRTYPLSRHQYRACLAAGKDWEKYAIRAVEEMDQYGGRTPPVTIIRKWVAGTEEEYQEKWIKILEKVQELCELLTAENVPDPVRIMAKEVLNFKL